MTQRNPNPPPLPQNQPTTIPYATPGVTGTGIVCPKCGGSQYKAVSFTWWGGVLGPKLFSHVKCLNCRAGFNSKTGRSNDTAIAIYLVVALVLAAAVFFAFAMSRS